MAPPTWPVERKGNKYVISSKGGSNKYTIPVGIAIRDLLKYADNLREVRQLINQKIVRIDGKIASDYRRHLSTMDILSINNEHYRIMPTRKGYALIVANDHEKKLLKITNKKSLKDNKTQLNFHDGRNIIVDKDVYKTGDTVLFDIKAGKMSDVIQCKRGVVALIVEGKSRGVVGKIEEIINVRGLQPSRILIKTGDKKIETLKNHVIVIGSEKPAVNIGG